MRSAPSIDNDQKSPAEPETDWNAAMGGGNGDPVVPFWKTALSFIAEVAKVVIISLAIIIPVRYFLIQPFYVKGASMEPTLHDYQYLIVDELTYRFSDPQRGEIVVLKNPRNPHEFFIKRILGLPEERLVIHNGEITVYQPGKKEGTAVVESYLPDEALTHGSVDISLEEDEYYVLGDNREASLDSRVFGPILKSSIIGRTWIRAWPWTALTYFRPPNYSTP